MENTQVDTNQNSQTNGSGVLNVILHGAFAFLVNRNQNVLRR